MVLITGGTGFLGSYLAWHLLQEGRQVCILKRQDSTMTMLNKVFHHLSEKDADPLLAQIRFVEGDLLDIYSLHDALEGITEVYHCGAVVSFDPAMHKRMMEINVRGTENMVNALLKRPEIRLCHVSSIAAIGRGGAEDLITEKTSWKTSRYNSHYAISKYGAEREVWRGIEEGLSAVIVNPAIILGYGETDSGTARIFHSVWKGLHIYPGGINGFVDVLDVVKAMILLMKNGISGERYILSVDNISYKRLFSDIADGLGKRKPGIRANAALAGIAWRVEAVRSSLFGSKPLLTRETAVTSMQEYIYSGKKILDVDAFSYTPFEDTIQRLSGYYKEEWGS